MKHHLKKITALFLLLVLCVSASVIPVDAAGPLKSKYFNSVSTISSVSSGTLYITNTYTISGSDFTSAEIHTYVERKVLGVFWSKVDNGETNKTWVSTSTSPVYSKSYSLSLTKTGTYRITAEYTFYGSNGSETITRQHTVTY